MRRAVKNVNFPLCCSGQWHHQRLEPRVTHLTGVSCRARMADTWGGLGQMYSKLCKHGDVRMWQDQTHDNTRASPARECLWRISITRGNQTIHASACRKEKLMIVVGSTKAGWPRSGTCGRRTRGVFLSPSPSAPPLSLSDRHFVLSFIRSSFTVR